MTRDDEILAALAGEKKINSDQAAEILSAAKFTGKPVGEIILERKIASDEDLAKLKAGIFKLPYADLAGREIGESALNTIPAEVAKNYRIVCFERQGREIDVGMIDPDNFKAIEAVDFLAKGAGLNVHYHLISEASMALAMKQYDTTSKEINKALKTREEFVSSASGKKSEEKDKAVKIEEVTKSAPVVKIVSVVIRHAIEGRASDIHIEPVGRESRVRYRIDGVLHTSLILPLDVHDSIVARIKVLANMKLDETRIPQDGRIRLTIDDKDYDFRVSTLPLLGREKVVMRILDVSRQVPNLEELGFQGAALELIKKNVTNANGLLLVTGPTGSGKSTTLFSLISNLNKEGINISTLEDPIEYMIKGVNQSQVKPEIGYTFATGLRHFLRQDPDVIMVGEIRDTETAELAIHAALTGHFVLSTLHTNDAVGAITRLVDMKVEPFLLSSTLRLIIAQRLVRKICPYCRVEAKLPSDFLADLMAALDSLPPEYRRAQLKDAKADKLVFFKGKGCPRCGNSGYAGRLAVTEVFEVNEQIRNMLVEGKTVFTNEEISRTQLFITFKQDGYLKVAQGQTTIEEVISVLSA